MTTIKYSFTNILLGVIIALALIFLIPATPPHSAVGQGPPPITIVPTSGPPGTSVAITRSDGGPLLNCLANGDPTGFTYQTITSPAPGMAIATYIVPSAAPLGSIVFECELTIGPSVPPPPTVVGTFRVTAPPPQPLPQPATRRVMSS